MCKICTEIYEFISNNINFVTGKLEATSSLEETVQICHDWVCNLRLLQLSAEWITCVSDVLKFEMKGRRSSVHKVVMFNFTSKTGNPFWYYTQFIVLTEAEGKAIPDKIQTSLKYRQGTLPSQRPSLDVKTLQYLDSWMKRRYIMINSCLTLKKECLFLMNPV